MWIELALAVPSVGAAFCARRRIATGLRSIPIIKSALPALPPPKPTTVLAEMLALEMVKQLPMIAHNGRGAFAFKGYEVAYNSDYHFCDGNNRVAMNYPLPGWEERRKWWLSLDRVELRGPKGRVDLQPDELAILRAALIKCCGLAATKKVVDLEQKRQDMALEAISHIMGIEAPKEAK